MNSEINAIRLRSGKWVSAQERGRTPPNHDGIMRPDDPVFCWEFEMPDNTFVHIRNVNMHLPGSSWHIWDSATNQERGEFKTYEEARTAFQEEIDFPHSPQW